jgi:phospholipid/cholesterol/gamma-HCH transport system permease protein
MYVLGFFGKLLRALWGFISHGRVTRHILVMQILFTFVEALPLTIILALALGAAINSLITPLLTSYSQEGLMYPLLIALVARELGPILSLFVVLLRSGTAIATEIAGIVLNHEAEAYISIGLDPLEHLAAPRLLALMLSLFFLNIYFAFFGLIASWLVAQLFNPIAATVYFGNLINAFKLGDLILILAKSMIFGLIIGTFSLYRGFSVERSSTEVPIASLKAVSGGLYSCILADAAISGLYYVIA